LQNALKDLMRALKTGSLSIAVPIIQGGMEVGISLSEQPEILT